MCFMTIMNIHCTGNIGKGKWVDVCGVIGEASLLLCCEEGGGFLDNSAVFFQMIPISRSREEKEMTPVSSFEKQLAIFFS